MTEGNILFGGQMWAVEVVSGWGPAGGGQSGRVACLGAEAACPAAEGWAGGFRVAPGWQGFHR